MLEQLDSIARIGAIFDTIEDGGLTLDDALEGLRRDRPQNAKQKENAVLDIARAKVTRATAMALALVSQLHPIRDDESPLEDLIPAKKELANIARTHLVKEAAKWARQFMDDDIEAAAEIAVETQYAGMETLMSTACRALIAQSRDGNFHKARDAFKTFDKITRAWSPMDNPRDELFTVIDAIGGMRTLVFAALVSGYVGMGLAALLSLVVYGHEDEIHVIEQLLPLEHTFVVAMYESEELELLADEAKLVLSAATTDSLDTLVFWRSLHNDTLQDLSERLHKAAGETATLRRKLTASEEANEKLRRSNETLAQKGKPQQAGEIVARNQEIVELRRQLDQAQGALAQSNERIRVLEARAAQAQPDDGPPAEEATASNAEAAAAAAPEPRPQPEAMAEDLELLRSRKGVLIGGHLIFIAKIKRLLPEWKCYASSEHKSVDEASLADRDLAVMFTDHCGHPLFESANKAMKKKGTETVFAKSVNPRTFLRKWPRSCARRVVICTRSTGSRRGGSAIPDAER